MGTWLALLYNNNRVHRTQFSMLVVVIMLYSSAQFHAVPVTVNLCMGSMGGAPLRGSEKEVG